MADSNVTVIEVVAQVKDETQPGADKSISSVSKLEAAMKKAQSNIENMKKRIFAELRRQRIKKKQECIKNLPDGRQLCQ